MSALCLNARSILNKFDSFEALVYDVQPHIVGVTETWAHEGVLDAELQLKGYQMFRCDRNTGNKGGGVLL